MSRLRIIHDTAYRYDAPVTFGPHRLVLRPREGHDVRLESMVLTITPAHEIRWSRDVFSNSVALVTFLEPANALHIRSDVVVDRSIHAAVDLARLPLAEYPPIYDPLEQTVVDVYRAFSFADDVLVVKDWLVDLKIPERGDAVRVLSLLNQTLFKQLEYRRREEKGVQTPAQTLRLGTGSCRDKATLFMEAARVLGIAARFASGYLDTAASQAGRAATHAWAEVYLPDSGWIGFDPTIGETTSSKHTVVGVSHHPRGVMPISGRFSSLEGRSLGLEVGVRMETPAEADLPGRAPTSDLIAL